MSVDSLSRCLVDGDPGELNRARRLRRKALAVSIFFEAVLVAGLLLWPLFTLEVFPHTYVVTRVPPYSAGETRAVAHVQSNPRPRPHSLPLQPILLSPVRIARRAEAMDHSLAPDTNTVSGEVGITGEPGAPGPFIPELEARRPNIAVPIEAPHRGALRMSEGVMQASLIHRVEPVYPRIARITHLAGEVRLLAIIGTDGGIRQIEVVSGSTVLAQAAVAAVRQWRYRPTRLSGKPVEVETYITVSFVLD